MVKVYLLDCDALRDGELYASHYNEMPQSRRKNIDSFKMESDRRLGLGVGILIKKFVGDEDEMTYGENDKPYLDGVHFNAAHSGSIAMLALADSEVGCDVELIKDNNAMRIADRFFFNDEYKMLVGEKDGDKRRELFFRLWTLKESFLKVTGEGLRLPLNSFAVNPLADEPTITQSYDDNSYFLKEYAIKNYRLAVCTQGDNEFENIQFIKPD